MRLRLFATLTAILSVAVIAPLAHADTLQTFQLENVTFDNSPNLATGTVVIDTTTGTFVSADINYTEGATPLSFISSSVFTDTSLTNQTYSYIADTSNKYDLVIDVHGSLNGYTGGLLCTVSSTCLDGSINYVGGLIQNSSDSSTFMETGSLQPIPAPEPSSLLLLGTGLIGAASMAKRRLMA